MSLKNRFSIFTFDAGILSNTEEVQERLEKYPYQNMGRTDRLTAPASFCGVDEIIDERNFNRTKDRILFNMITQNRVINRLLVNKVLENRIQDDFPHLIGTKSGEEYQWLKDEITNELASRFLVKTSLTQIGVSFKSKLLYIFTGETEALTVAKRMSDILDLKNVKLFTLANSLCSDGIELREDFQLIMANLLTKSLEVDHISFESVSLTQGEASFKLEKEDVNQITEVVIDEKTLVIDNLTIQLKEGSVDGFWRCKFDKHHPGKFWLEPKFNSRGSGDLVVDFIEYDEGVAKLKLESTINLEEGQNTKVLKEEVIRNIMGMEFES